MPFQMLRAFRPEHGRPTRSRLSGRIDRAGPRPRGWTSRTGSVHFLPSDDDRHTFVTSHTADFEYNALVLPRGHVTDILVSEHHAPRFEAHRVLNPHDLNLQDAITRVFDACAHEDHSLVTRADEAARRLILRLTELCGGGKPD
ncbi:MAG: hypothetical protein ACKOTB_17060, partial [Planctomycetia bacterium]